MKAKLLFCSGSRVGCGSIVRRAVDLAGWILPSAILALIPKCPMCLAGYVAVWTGIGLSLSAGIYFQASVLVASIALILFLAGRSVHCVIHKLYEHDRSV